MGSALSRRLALLLVLAQLLVAWGPVCAFACAAESDTLVLNQSAAASDGEVHACKCGMRALCHVAFTPALTSAPQLASVPDTAPVPSSPPAFLLTRYIAPLPEPPVA